jgi:hypothetical protein
MPELEPASAVQGLVLTVALRDAVALFESIRSAAEVSVAPSPYSSTPARPSTPSLSSSSLRSTPPYPARVNSQQSHRMPEFAHAADGKPSPRGTAAQSQAQEQLDRDQVEVLVCSVAEHAGKCTFCACGVCS